MISSIGNSGARSSGPTGCPVPGCSTGCAGFGMSAATLYPRRGRCGSSSRYFVCSTARRINDFRHGPHARGFDCGDRGDPSIVAEKQRLPRSLWTGSISFGLVNVPVRIFSAVHEHKLHFHLIPARDDSPIGYEKICKLEDKPVPSDEIVKAFEYSKGEFVQLTDEDFEAVQVEGQRTIDLEDFVPYEQIDPAFFAHTYLVGPQEGAERPYSLLVRAMEGSGLAGIGKFVMRNR